MKSVLENHNVARYKIQGYFIGFIGCLYADKGRTIKINKIFQKPFEYIKKHTHTKQIYEKKEKKLKKNFKKFVFL